jgi:hypothetical protein
MLYVFTRPLSPLATLIPPLPSAYRGEAKYLPTANRLLRQQIPDRVRLSDGKQQTFAELETPLSKQALAERHGVSNRGSEPALTPAQAT